MAMTASVDMIENEALPIDPFGSVPNWASRISGLGGPDLAGDPAYVFRSVPVRPAIGEVTFTIQFHDLVATTGTLIVEVRAMSAFPGAEPSPLESLTIALADVVAAHGIVEAQITSRRNTLYTVAGYIEDDTDIACVGISLSVDRRASAEEHGRGWGHQRLLPQIRGERLDSLMIGSWLTKLDVPSFETPTSQVWSARQSRSPACRSAVSALGIDAESPENAWGQAYVLQCLESYGMLEGHSAGLGLLTEGRTLPAVLAARDCEILATDQVAAGQSLADPGLGLERLRYPDLCSDEDFYDRVHYTGCDIQTLPPSFLYQFDFLWSVGANRMIGPDHFIYFALNSMGCLRSEGLAVHVFDYMETPRDPMASMEDGALTRKGVERLVVDALSHRNSVAHLRFRHGGPSDPPGVIRPFGIVIRRGKGG